MSLICLAGAGATVRLAAAITLVWTHSVQKSLWEEDWIAEPAGLRVVEMRIEGSGAGMEPPPDAVLRNGRYVSHPDRLLTGPVELRRSGATADYRVCISGTCRPMGDLLPPGADPVTLSRCD